MKYTPAFPWSATRELTGGQSHAGKRAAATSARRPSSRPTTSRPRAPPGPGCPPQAARRPTTTTTTMDAASARLLPRHLRAAPASATRSPTTPPVVSLLSQILESLHTVQGAGAHTEGTPKDRASPSCCRLVSGDAGSTHNARIAQPLKLFCSDLEDSRKGDLHCAGNANDCCPDGWSCQATTDGQSTTCACLRFLTRMLPCFGDQAYALFCFIAYA